MLLVAVDISPMSCHKKDHECRNSGHGAVDLVRCRSWLTSWLAKIRSLKGVSSFEEWGCLAIAGIANLWRSRAEREIAFLNYADLSAVYCKVLLWKKTMMKLSTGVFLRGNAKKYYHRVFWNISLQYTGTVEVSQRKKLLLILAWAAAAKRLWYQEIAAAARGRKQINWRGVWRLLLWDLDGGRHNTIAFECTLSEEGCMWSRQLNVRVATRMRSLYQSSSRCYRTVKKIVPVRTKASWK